MSVSPRKPPFQFGLRSLFAIMFCISAGHWLLNASRDALVVVYAFTIATILYLDPSRDA